MRLYRNRSRLHICVPCIPSSLNHTQMGGELWMVACEATADFPVLSNEEGQSLC